LRVNPLYSSNRPSVLDPDGNLQPKMIPLISDEDLWARVSPKDNDPPRIFLTKRLITKEEKKKKLLVINSLSGAFDLFYADEWDRINQCNRERNFRSLPKNIYSFLARRGYIYFDETDEDRH